MSAPADELGGRLRALEERGRAEIEQAESVQAVAELRVRYLGRKGVLTRELQALGALAPERRRSVGEAANRVKEALAAVLDAREQAVAREQAARDLAVERLDVTLPGRAPRLGMRHPLSIALSELRAIFADLGFEVAGGPEVETAFHNFAALNIPEGHPARDESDTLFLPGGLLLRTHTSPVQIRTMESRRPPIRIIAPGRCFRNDAPDATHSPVFYQIEGLAVDEGLTFAHLKATLEQFARAFIGPDTRLRFHPDYFPFVEPGAGVEVSCSFCGGGGCPTCKHSGWIEVLGAGMVHPAVFEAVGYDPDRYTGFAFGTGVERLAMLKYGIADIRTFYDNDLRVLAQFN